MSEIRIAIVGVGNCASSLLQGISYYAESMREGGDEQAIGLGHPRLGGYAPGDIRVVAAIDIDARKVGLPLNDALIAPPNNTQIFHDLPAGEGPVVAMGNVLDGVSEHMADYPDDRRFIVADRPNASAAEIEKLLRDSGAEILMCYLPVGSQQAVEFYAECCLNTGVSLINCMPVFIVSDKTWGERFRKAGIPCVGDDVKAQFGATVVHRVLTRLMHERGVKLDATYQLNTGGNTDFLNMLNHRRLSSKRISKTQAVQSQLDVPLPDDQVHIGPSDYVPWQNDNKVCFLRLEGRGFGGVGLEPRAAPQRGGFAQLRRRDHRRHPLLQARPREGTRRAPRRHQRLHDEAPAGPVHRQPGPRDARTVHRLRDPRRDAKPAQPAAGQRSQTGAYAPAASVTVEHPRKDSAE